MNKKIHNPLFHVSKRSALPWYASWGIRAGGLVVALVLCALVTMLLTGENPISVYAAIIDGSFGTVRKVWKLGQGISILLLISLAVTPAFKMRFWNIGAEGQVLAGALVTATIMWYGGSTLPTWQLLIFSFIASIIMGAIWGGLPAVFKAKWNTNETLFTLMMNYVAIKLVEFFINFWDGSGKGDIGVINQSTRAGWLPVVGGHDYLLIILVAAVICVLMFFYLKYSKHGYELSVVGESENTARYVGINVPKVVIRTMLLSGALCGLTGMLLVTGTDHTLKSTLAGGRGFTAVMVSWLAQFNPFVMIFTSFLLVMMETGAVQIAKAFTLSTAFSDILTGIILFCIIGCEFFINYKLVFRHKEKKEA